MSKPTKSEAEAKVFELTQQLIKVKLDQKDTNSSYKERIREIESEIKAVIEDYKSNGV